MFWEVSPEVPGTLTDSAIVDWTCHPPVVSSVEFEFDGWMGDELITTFPVFLIGPNALGAVQSAGLGGYEIGPAEITLSEQYREVAEFLPVDEEPAGFVWFKPTGQAGRDDFGINEQHRMVLSDRALKVLRPLMPTADVVPYQPS